MTEPQLAKAGPIPRSAPDENRRPDKGQRDEDVERAAPRRQIVARARNEKERERNDELDRHERDEGQEATPAALFI